MKRFLVGLLVVPFLVGCGNSGEVTQDDAAKNKAAFSNEAYEKAMRDSGKGAELEAQKKREAERDQ